VTKWTASSLDKYLTVQAALARWQSERIARENQPQSRARCTYVMFTWKVGMSSCGRTLYRLPTSKDTP